MSLILNLLLAAQILLLLVLVPRFLLLGLIVAAAGRRRLWGDGACPTTVANAPDPSPTRFTILIPAHDESGAIGVTVRSCQAVAYEPEFVQIVVLADNCSDTTAAEAREAGAVVIERTDAQRRSKGYALEDFFAVLQHSAPLNPTDAFVLVDADTSVDPGLLRAFDLGLRQGDDFIQGYYSVRNPDASWRTELLTYAFALANGVWLLGQDGLGLSVGLKGNGMCFRAAALTRHPWRAAGLVEDMEFAWRLRLAGERVRFRPEARVLGEMVSRGGSAAAAQRQRWEAGRQALRATFRRAVWQGRRLSWGHRALLAIDLDFPPLGRLVTLLGVLSVLVLLGAVLGVGSTSVALGLMVLAAAWLTLASYLVAPFLLLGLPLRFALALIHAPGYLVWKATLGRLRPPDRWVRTPREAPPAA